MTINPRIAIFTGGVGGSKLTQGIAAVSDPAEITVIGNTGDDFLFQGLRVCPDLDTPLYTLAGLVNPESGWGIKDETFRVLESLEALGEESWFKVGDRDLATHLYRSRRLKEGIRLSEIMLDLCAKLEVTSRVLPVTDESIKTMVQTPKGWLDFQTFFVREKCEPDILDVAYELDDRSAIAPEARTSLENAGMILFAPSNPVASIGPILAVPGLRELIGSLDVPRLAVSPFVGGISLKGPSDRMMRAKGLTADPVGTARLYQGLIDRILIDQVDEEHRNQLEEMGLKVAAFDTIMRTDDDKRRVAQAAVDLAFY